MKDFAKKAMKPAYRCTVALVFERVQVKIEIREIYILDLSFGDNTINPIRCKYQGSTCKILSKSNYICRSHEIFAVQMYCKGVTKVFERVEVNGNHNVFI